METMEDICDSGTDHGWRFGGCGQSRGGTVKVGYRKEVGRAQFSVLWGLVTILRRIEWTWVSQVIGNLIQLWQSPSNLDVVILNFYFSKKENSAPIKAFCALLRHQQLRHQPKEIKAQKLIINNSTDCLMPLVLWLVYLQAYLLYIECANN